MKNKWKILIFFLILAVTDLDQNGRLELVISRLEGSGRYTYSDYYEVNKECDGLIPCDWLDKKSDSEADIMVDSVPVYFDSNNKINYYIFQDLIQDGITLMKTSGRFL